eukprot:scaffold96784_cov66-Phaeocystis_antarctica.AAC.2
MHRLGDVDVVTVVVSSKFIDLCMLSTRSTASWDCTPVTGNWARGGNRYDYPVESVGRDVDDDEATTLRRRWSWFGPCRSCVQLGTYAE